MVKPKKVVLKDRTIVWEVRERQGGRSSNAIKRRFRTAEDAQNFAYGLEKDKRERQQGYVKVGSFLETTFREESDQWLEDLALRSSPGHYLRAKSTISDFNKNYGGLEPNKITLAFLSDLQKSLRKRPGKKSDTTLSNASVNRYTEAICAVLNFSALQQRIPYNPVARFKKLPRNSKETGFWNEEEAGSFLGWAAQKYSDWNSDSRLKARKNYIAYLLALNTGLRAGEIWGLKPQDFCFDDEGATLFVRRQFDRVKKEFAPLKGELVSDKDKSRHVPCSRELREELEKHVKHNGIRSDMSVFQSVFGNPVDHDSFSDRFDRDIKKWGGKRIRFHDLRHTAATLMLSQGVDVKTVKEILGHEDISTTMRYVHLIGGKIRQVSGTFSVKPAIKLRLVDGTLQTNHG